MLSFFQLYCYVVNGTSIFFNAILLILSAHKSIEAIQELRYFLSNISLSGMIFAWCLMLLQPQNICRGTMTIRLPHGPINLLNDYYVKLVASVAVTFYLYGMLSFPLFFVYRTMILVNSTSYGQYFNKKNLLVVFGVIFGASCVEGAFLYYSNLPYGELFDRLNRTSTAMQQLYPTTTPSPTAVPPSVNMSIALAQAEEQNRRAIPLFGDDYTRNPLILYFYGMAVIAHVVSYLIILISAHFMLKTLKTKQGYMSRDTLLANEVLVHAVFAEAFLPLLLSAPVAANAVLTFFYENSLKWQEFLPMYCICLVPLLSPLISIFFIKPYRHAIKDFLICRCLKNTAAAEAANNTMANDT